MDLIFIVSNSKIYKYMGNFEYWWYIFDDNKEILTF